MKTKFKLKTLNSGTLGKALTASVLACVLSCGAVMPVEAAYSYSTILTSAQTVGKHSVSGTASAEGFLMITAESADDDVHVKVNGQYVAGEILGQYVIVPISKDATYEIYDSYDESSVFNNTVVRFASGGGGASYTADNGIIISSDNKVSVKAGTNVTVNANGVSVTGNGSVADGNTGLINGDKLYDEVRSSANGNYVKLSKIQYNESFCHTKPPGLCPSLKKQAVLLFLRPIYKSFF